MAGTGSGRWAVAAAVAATVMVAAALLWFGVLRGSSSEPPAPAAVPVGARVGATDDARDDAAVAGALDRLGQAGGDAAVARAAAAELEQVVVRRPDDARALFALGWAYQLAGDPVRAETRYREACLLAERGDLAEIRYFGRFNLGVLYRDQRHLDVAAAELGEAAQIGEAHLDLLGGRVGDAWHSQGRVLRELGRYPEALVALEHAAARKPTSGPVRFDKGLTLWRAGQRELARIELARAVLLAPSLATDVEALESEVVEAPPPPP